MQRLVTRAHTWERGLLWPLAGEYELTADTVEGAITPRAVRYWATWLQVQVQEQVHVQEQVQV